MRPPKRGLQWTIVAVAALALLWLVFALMSAGQALAAVGAAAFGATALYVYGVARTVAWKYLYPGVAGMLLFVAFPLLYTVQIAFTNYSSSNLLDRSRARAYLLDQTVANEARSRPFTLHAEGAAWRLLLGPHEGDAGEPLVSAPLKLDGTPAPAPVAMQALGTLSLGAPLGLRGIIGHRDALAALRLQLPDGSVIRYAGLREFGPIEPLWKEGPDGSLTQQLTGVRFKPNPDTGFYETVEG